MSFNQIVFIRVKLSKIVNLVEYKYHNRLDKRAQELTVNIIMELGRKAKRKYQISCVEKDSITMLENAVCILFIYTQNVGITLWIHLIINNLHSFNSICLHAAIYFLGGSVRNAWYLCRWILLGTKRILPTSAFNDTWHFVFVLEDGF